MIPKLVSIFNHKCPRCLVGDMHPDTNSYHLKETMHMHNHCPECDLNFMPEPGFYYGAMYVSYAFTIAIGVALFVAEIVLFPPFSTLTFLIALTAILLICAPYTFRTSRAIWINLFVHYDAKIHAEVQEKKKLIQS